MKRIISLLLILLFICSSALAADTDTVTAYFLDVGSCDATVITCGYDVIVIDAGSSSTGGNKVASCLSNYWKKLTGGSSDQMLNVMAISTHPHDDHVGGFNKIIADSGNKAAHYTVAEFYSPVSEYNSDLYDETDFYKVKKRVHNAKIPFIEVTETIRMKWGKMNITMYTAPYEENNCSIVTKVQFRGQTIIIAADAENKEETDLLNRTLSLHADILRVGHHGSDTSTSERWLKAINPHYAIISVGDSDKNPSPTVLSRLLDAHCSVWRTNRDGTIIATLDGTIVNVSSESTYDVSWKNAKYIGNKKNHKLHLADCGYVPTTNTNKEGFNSLEEAIAAGYTENEQCQRCKPFSTR